MADINNMEDILDVRDIIARVEELREQRKPWTAGKNMPGYMPDSEPCSFQSWEEARDSLVEDFERDTEELESDPAANQVLDALNALKDGEEFGYTFGTYHYWLSKAAIDDGLDSDERAELKSLEELLEEMRGNGGDEQWDGDWYPITLIRDSYFTDYAQELVSDVGDMPREIPSYIEIDWEATARNIRQDYCSADFDGTTYWYR